MADKGAGDNYSLPLGPKLIGAGNSGYTRDVRLSIRDGTPSLSVQFIGSNPGWTPGTVTGTFWGAHMGVWLCVEQGSLCERRSQAAWIARACGRTQLSPAALLNWISPLAGVLRFTDATALLHAIVELLQGMCEVGEEAEPEGAEGSCSPGSHHPPSWPSSAARRCTLASSRTRK
jgi:hypothetical protein